MSNISAQSLGDLLGFGVGNIGRVVFALSRLANCVEVFPQLFAGQRAEFEPPPHTGRRLAVHSGQTVGLIHEFDHIDAEPWPAVARVDGVVPAQAWVARVPRGQHIVVVGRDITQ